MAKARRPRRIVEIPGLDENLRLQDSVAQRLVDLRHRHGALSLETIEAKAVFDGDVLSDLDLDRKNRAKQLIEDFMIAANGVTATYLESKKFPSLRRVLRSPERWDRIAQLASGFGRPAPQRAGRRGPRSLPRRGDARPTRRSSPTSPWPWSSSSGEASTRSIYPAASRPDTSGWR